MAINSQMAELTLANQAPASQDMDMSPVLLSDDDQPGAAGPVAESYEGSRPGNLIWEGSTWDACPTICGCFAPLCCLSTKWRITDQVIDTKSGCCGSKEDSLYVKRMRDISYEGSCLKRFFCCGRATVTIYSSDRTHPELHLTTFGAKAIYRNLRDAWQGGAGHAQVDVMAMDQHME